MSIRTSKRRDYQYRWQRRENARPRDQEQDPVRGRRFEQTVRGPDIACKWNAWSWRLTIHDADGNTVLDANEGAVDTLDDKLRLLKVRQGFKRKEEELGADLKFEDILPEVAGIYPKVMQDGDMEAGAWSCGMVAGLIHDVPTVAELINRIMNEAETIITERLAGMQAA
jgi:hypothetical protein